MEVKKILAVRNDRFGEFLLNIPAFRALKQRYPGARLILAVDPYVRELACNIDFVDEVICWENRRHSFLELLKFAARLRKEHIEVCAIFNPSREANILAYLAGIPIRIGYARKAAFLLTHKIKDLKFLGNKHEIEYNIDLVNAIGAYPKDKTLSLLVKNDIINKLSAEYHLEKSGFFVAIHPWTSDPIKQWPVERFLGLCRLLVDSLGVKVIIVGGGREAQEGGKLFDSQQNNLVNLVGKTSLMELAAVLKQCDLLVSGDSGPVHLASCVGTPVVAIFRNDMPGKGPLRWGPAEKRSIVVEKGNLADITIEEVFTQVKRALNK